MKTHTGTRYNSGTNEYTHVCLRCQHEWDGHDRYHRWPIRLGLRRLHRVRLFSRHGWESNVDRYGRRVFGWALSLLWLQIKVGPKGWHGGTTLICPSCRQPFYDFPKPPTAARQGTPAGEEEGGFGIDVLTIDGAKVYVSSEMSTEERAAVRRWLGMPVGEGN